MKKTSHQKIYVFCTICFLAFANKAMAVDLFDPNKPLPIATVKSNEAINMQVMPKAPDVLGQRNLALKNDAQKSTAKPVFSFSSADNSVNAHSGIIGLNAINPVIRSIPKIKKNNMRKIVNRENVTHKNLDWYQYNSPAFKAEDSKNEIN